MFFFIRPIVICISTVFVFYRVFFLSYRFNLTLCVLFEILLNFNRAMWSNEREKNTKKNQRIKMPNAFAFAWICRSWYLILMRKLDSIRLHLMTWNGFNLNVMTWSRAQKNQFNHSIFGCSSVFIFIQKLSMHAISRMKRDQLSKDSSKIRQVIELMWTNQHSDSWSMISFTVSNRIFNYEFKNRWKFVENQQLLLLLLAVCFFSFFL